MPQRKHRPTQVDVARLAGVSRQTVSLVARGDSRVSDAARQAVEAAMDELHYHLNVSASALAAKRSRMVGIVMFDMVNPFHADIMEVLRRRLEGAGLVPLMTTSDNDAAQETAAIRRFIQLGVDAVLVVAPATPPDELARLGAQVPLVLVTHAAAPEGVDYVYSDDALGMGAIVSHLVGRGFGPIYFLGYDRHLPGDTAAARQAGYVRAMREAGRTPQLVDVGNRPVADALAEIPLAEGVALACHNDLIGIEALGLVIEAGWRPGRQVGVTGYDDTRFAAFPGIALTSVNQGTEQLADAALALAQARIEGEAEGRQHRVIEPRLMVRASTSP